MLTGVLVIISSVAIRLFAYSCLKTYAKIPTWIVLYLFGVVVHVAMLLLMFTLPGGASITVIKKIGLPIIILYPIATILAGKILSDQAELEKGLLQHGKFHSGTIIGTRLP